MPPRDQVRDFPQLETVLAAAFDDLEHALYVAKRELCCQSNAPVSWDALVEGIEEKSVRLIEILRN